MRLLKKLFLLSALLSGSGLCPVSADDTPPTIRIGIIADAQYADCEPHGARFYRNSLPKLEECVTEFNKRKVDFTVNLGDMIDRDPADFGPALALLDKLESPLYNTTGNHDYKGAQNNGELYRKLGMPSAYYSFGKGGWLFIILNTNEVAAYSNIKGTPLQDELDAMLKRIARDKRKNAQGWNGGISSAQMKWLDGELARAQKQGERVIVFAHHPLYPATEFTALNDREILETLAAYPCVKAVINGHHHTGAYGVYKGIPCITTEGMVETEHGNAYAIVEIRDRIITVKGSGRSRSYTIALDGETGQNL